MKYSIERENMSFKRQDFLTISLDDVESLKNEETDEIYISDTLWTFDTPDDFIKQISEKCKSGARIYVENFDIFALFDSALRGEVSNADVRLALFKSGYKTFLSRDETVANFSANNMALVDQILDNGRFLLTFIKVD